MKVEQVNRQAGSGLRLVHVTKAIQVSRAIRTLEVREATTGRPVTVPRIWAVAAAPVRPLVVVDKPAVAAAPKVELAFYRKYTEAMLRRYLRVSMEVGRVPCLMGKELFRGYVSSYKMTTFEDGVAFSIDVERCLAKLRTCDQQVLQRIAIQGYTQAEAAPLLGIGLRMCVVRYAQALDRLTEVFLERRLLEPLKGCQEADDVKSGSTR